MFFFSKGAHDSCLYKICGYLEFGFQRFFFSHMKVIVLLLYHMSIRFSNEFLGLREAAVADPITTALPLLGQAMALEGCPIKERKGGFVDVFVCQLKTYIIILVTVRFHFVVIIWVNLACFVILLLMVRKSGDHHLGCFWNHVNNGIN